MGRRGGDRRVVRRPQKAVYRNDSEGGPDAKRAWGAGAKKKEI